VNMVGQVLTEQKNQHGTLFTLDIAQLAGGIYFVEINEGGKTVSRKVVKEW
jgi:hypothetical protein